MKQEIHSQIKQQNILIKAFKECEKEKLLTLKKEKKLYGYLGNIPAISTTVLVVDKLNKLGYKITKI